MSGLNRIRSGLSVGLLAGMLSSHCLGAEFSPDSKVTDLTVYRDGALVTREARVTLPAGDHRVVLREIPSVADPNSVRWRSPRISVPRTSAPNTRPWRRSWEI
jgi:N-terminal domain of unknown function (DUF4140)